MTAETIAANDLITLAAETLHHCGEPGAGARLRDEHDRDRDGRCRGCPHNGTVAPWFPCLLCMRGDHRRCRAGSCTVAGRWHDEVREAGTAAAQEANQEWAVVSTLGNTIEVAGTADGLNQAKIVLRDVLCAAGYLGNPEGKGLVYVVRATDGAFL